jgi:hypothetical protein
MKKGLLGIFICSIHYVALSQGVITFNNSSELVLDPSLPNSSFPVGFTFRLDDGVPIPIDDLDGGIIFFPGTGGQGGGSSYFNFIL